MKVPDIRIFRERDFDEVADFLRAEGFDPPRSAVELKGVALVAREDDPEDEHAPIIGFVWALWAPGLRIAYVDYFAVKSSLRKSSVALFLGSTLARYLQEVEVVRVLWMTPTWNWTFIKAMKGRGAKDLGARQALVTELDEADTGDEEDGDGRLLREWAAPAHS